MPGFFEKLKGFLGINALEKPEVSDRQEETELRIKPEQKDARVSPSKNAFPSTPPSPKKVKTRKKTLKKIPPKPLEIILGLDFGTAATKVIVGIPNFPGSPLFVVPFGDLAHKSSKFILPTSIWFDEHGNFSLSQPSPRAERLVNLKSCFINTPQKNLLNSHGKPSKVKPKEAVTAYLALVIKYSLEWFKKDQQKAFGKYKLEWVFNLGLPAAKLEKKPIVKAYRQVQGSAWKLSQTSNPLGISLVKNTLKNPKPFKPSGTLKDYDIVPEVAAEVVGYSKSNLRTEGLHLLVDVGAGTLDGCVFNLFEREGEDNYSIFLADIKPFGCFNLLETIFKNTQNLFSGNELNILTLDDPLEPLPDNFETLIAEEPKREEILEISMENQKIFKYECQTMLRKLIWLTKLHRYPTSNAWNKNEQLTAFLCGGGSSMRFYKILLEEISEWLKETAHNGGLRIIELPPEEGLQTNLDGLPYHRLAVARGLSIPSFNIGDIKLPQEIEDMPPLERKSLEHRYISKDMV